MSIRIGIGLDVFGAGIDANAQTIYNRIIADGGVSNLSRLNFFVKGLKAIYGDLANVPVCYDAHWIGYKLGSGTGATAGQAAAKLYSLTVAGDAVQATAASQPLLLSHNGASSDNYWYGSGVTGNYVSTPNAAANQITGDIEIIGKKINLNAWPVSYRSIATKTVAANRAYEFDFIGKKLYLELATGVAAATGYTSTTDIDASPNLVTLNTNFWVKVTRNATSGDIKFYTSLDGITYTQLGATVAGFTGSTYAGTSTLNIGGDIAGAQIIIGKIGGVTIANSIGGAPVVDFNPAQYNASTSQTAWTSATGEVWTINTGTATTGYKGVLVSRILVQSDGVDDRLTSGTLTSRTSFTLYLAVNVLSFSGRFIDGSSALTKTLYGTSSNISMFGGAGGFDFVDEVTNRLQMLTANFQSAPNVYARINNNTRATTASSIGSAASTGINLFTDGGGANPANVMVNTVIQSSTNDPLNDAMYNLIRSLNNNAF